MTARPLTLNALMGVALLGFAAACGSHPADEGTSPTKVAGDSVSLDSTQQAQMQTAPVAEQDYSPTIITTGTVTFNGDESAQVTSPISGPVSKVVADLGARVGVGDVLATVASPDFAGAVAEFRKADAAWRNAKRIADLDEKLFANDALSRSDLDQARSDLAAATADRDAATSALHALGVADSTVASLANGGGPTILQPAIRSPLAGTVVERLVTPGQLLEAGATPAFTVADLSTVWVLANVFEADMGFVREGAKAVVTLNEGSDSFPGRVAHVGAVVDPESKATAVRIVVPNRDRLLKQNMLVHVTLWSTRTRHGILVPVTAVLRDDDNLPFVFTATGQGRYLRRRITLGARIGDDYEVTQGLTTGETLVTNGALYLAEAIGQ